MFQGLRWRLLASYLMVMAITLGVFGVGVYFFLTRSLYDQLNKKMLTLAQAATLSFADIENNKGYLQQVDEVPWRDIFNRDDQSLEWFDTEGNLLTRAGVLELNKPLKLSQDRDPKTNIFFVETPSGSQRVFTYTISVFIKDNNPQPNQATLKGFIRASQSMEDVENIRQELLLGLGVGGMLTLGLVSVGGLWLTQRAIQPVEDSFRLLKQFTADASHELRSPLTAIKTSVDVMRNHPERIHPKDAKKLVAIASATTQMSSLVQDLLFLARTDAAEYKLNIEHTAVSLNQILENLWALLEPSAQVKGVTLHYQALSKITVFGDKVQLSRLFTNLLENAVQYTPSGGKVELELTKQNRHAMVKVRDTGIGIEPEQLPLIFDRFWRADKARSRREGGTGLGLSIVQAIAHKHGGRITVTSNVGEGSCFLVRLPLFKENS